MGNACVRYKDELKATRLDSIDYKPQAEDEYQQLDSHMDLEGHVEQDHVVHPRIEVYGFPPKDMKPVDWSRFGIVVARDRPSPYEFPAFEHEKPQMTHDAARDSEHKTIDSKEGVKDLKPVDPKKRLANKEEQNSLVE